ncbi:MAG: FecR family protein [Bacteroidota bacterium]
MDMNRENFLKLLTRKLAKELTAEEQQQFDEACNNNPEYRQIANELLVTTSTAHHLPQAALKKAWQQIKQAEEQVPEQPARRLNSYWLKMAAAVLLMISAGLVFYLNQKHGEAVPLLSLNSTYQKLYKTLDDGTTICLNRNSVIQYNVDFGKTKREITLQGEAFFDVAKNPAVPLFIHVGEIIIEVKGTAFNVSQQPKQIAIALVRGHIMVSNKADEHVALNPNEQLIASSNSFKVLALDTTLKVAAINWTGDSLVFKKEKLINLALLLEKKYRVKIEIRNEKLKLKQFSGVIKKEQLTEALDALKLSFPFSYVVSNKVVTIK